MKLNENFDKSLEDKINLYEPLADWFQRNQEMMAYFKLTHSGCLHFEDSQASQDIIILGRLANAVFTYLENIELLQITPEEAAFNAALLIAYIYERDKDKLSENAKKQYYLDDEKLIEIEQNNVLKRARRK